ncbi:DUF981 domain-containing protein [Georgenia halophila]|uniref:DUF981 domain-containing protein n=1 Tax=Georgenia halophila TaxID=620889 RepID=A0ABP8L9U4_9MICO
MTIDWASMPTYNTIMAVAAGVGLLGLVQFFRDVLRRRDGVSTDGWALNFGVLGTILTTTGLHMTLTWPLAAGGFPFDNIIFGETSLGFGVLLLAAALYLWRRGSDALVGANVAEHLARVARPVSIFVAFLGGALIAIAIAGVRYQLFAAPPQEPISGAFAQWPLVEAIFMSGLLALVGVGAIAFPFAVRSVEAGRTKAAPVVIAGWSWAVSGTVVGLFGVMNFFTHIGLIVNTM